jgi:hypothetical protein
MRSSLLATSASLPRPDSDIAARAQATGAVLLTRDLDFADIRQYPPED